jgi:hypothetical protein
VVLKPESATIAEVQPLGWKTRISRNRFLTGVGTVLMGATTARLFSPASASASPKCCGPSPGCQCCNGRTCCVKGCKRNTTLCAPPYGYWVCCDYSEGERYGCYDWLENGARCICAGGIGPCP